MAIDQPQRAADQQAGDDVLAELINQGRGREVKIVSTADQQHRKLAKANHAGDVQARESEYRRHREADAERPSPDLAHPPHRDEQHGRDQDDRDDARQLPEQLRAGIIDAAAPGDVLRFGEGID